MSYAKAAEEWRTTNGYTEKGGVVVFFEGTPQGWVDELRNPEEWQPGSIAVDESDTEWIAHGGDNQNGAASWIPY